MDQKQTDQRFNNRQMRYEQTQNHISGKFIIFYDYLYKIYENASYL